MGQFDANATKEQLEQMEREFARKRAAAARRRAAELARLSEERAFTDEPGTTWTYIVVDGNFARLCGCETECESLAVPDELEGFPVREIDAEALSGLDAPLEILCADGIQSIGPYAFRGCRNLRRLVLPAQTPSFSSSWVARCPKVEELVLPDNLQAIEVDVLACQTVKRLVIGANTSAVKPGAFRSSAIESLRIDERNIHLKTDGTCIYTHDGETLVALARKVESYEVAPGCRRIAEKAFAGAAELKHVAMPEGLRTVEPLAFANCGIKELAFPSTVLSIGPKACLRCLSLEKVQLNEGLRTIGEEAFAGSALTNLHVPATVAEIGRSVTARSRVKHAGPDATFSIDAANEAYFVEPDGCLYARRADGTHLAQMLDPDAAICSVREGTVAVDEKAFAYHTRIASVILPDELKSVASSAFRVCRKLKEVRIPDSLESLGADAFIDTALERISIPAGLTEIGANALVTDGAHHEGVPPALRRIDVSEQNPRFFMHAGMLCRRTGDNATTVVIFTNSCADVDFPQTTEAVEDYAFNNAFDIDRLYLNARLRSIGACGLSVECAIKTVHIDVAEPIEGRSSFLLRFPGTSRSVHGFLLALGGLGSLYLPDIMAQYDNCIASARDYRAPGGSDNASAYDQVRLIVGRLQDSVLLTEDNRRRYRLLVSDNIAEICLDISRHDDRDTIRQLADLGLLTADNIDPVIDTVNRLQDASMTAYLLELKRQRFGRATADYDL